MLIGLFIAVFVLYRKPRDYHDIEADTSAAEVFRKSSSTAIMSCFRHDCCRSRAGYRRNLALSALCGLIIIIVFRAIKWSDIGTEQIEGGIRLMGQIAIIMLVAGGYASVIKATGGIDALVNAGISAVGGGRALAAGCHYAHWSAGDDGYRHLVRHCACAGCAVRADVQLAWVLHSGYYSAHLSRRCPGDAGSPASDTTLGPTSGLNADGQRDHIRDTCIPTFIAFNIPIMICAILMSQVL